VVFFFGGHFFCGFQIKAEEGLGISKKKLQFFKDFLFFKTSFFCSLCIWKAKDKMATSVQSPSVERRDSQTSRDECIAFLGKGKSVQELSERCKELLGANSKVGLLARRNSAVGRTWSPSDGHNSRSYAETTFGPAQDIPSDSKSVGEIFMEGKSPEAAEKIKKSIARTASRGAKIRTDDVVTHAEIQKEAKVELQKRNSRQNH
jgi:hypothetical protein